MRRAAYALFIMNMNRRYKTLMVTVILASIGVASAQESTRTNEPQKTAAQSTKEQLDQLRKTARDDVPRTAQALRAMNPATMNDEDRATWVRLTREAAVRSGDAATLRALSGQDDPFALLPLAQVLLANGYLNEGNFAAANETLAKIAHLEHLNTRDQRRYWALKVRLAQLAGNLVEERAAVEHVVHELGRWSSDDCQSCHGDLKNPKAVALLDVQAQWLGKRFVELMKLQGDAQAVQARALAKLAADPKDDDARVFLAYALLALDRPAEAQARINELSWAAVPGRQGAAPRMMFMWP